jgi:hypothetical protein
MKYFGTFDLLIQDENLVAWVELNSEHFMLFIILAD